MMLKIKRLVVSGRSRPMWTVENLDGPVFSRRETYGLVFEAWPKKRDAQKILVHAQAHGLEATREKFRIGQ